jgi:predicted N-acetyltransferase YhbS
VTTPCTIVPLAARPDLVPLIAEWGHATWGHLRSGDTPAKRAERLKRHLQADAVPSTIVALDAAGVPVGSAALLAHDIDGDPRGPWLASVYVVPERRGEGFGKAVVGAIEASAARAGIDLLYLFTPDKMSFYAALGWAAVETLDYRGEHITVMTKRVNSRGGGEMGQS